MTAMADPKLLKGAADAHRKGATNNSQKAEHSGFVAGVGEMAQCSSRLQRPSSHMADYSGFVAEED
eukprot:9140857-Alexandrium_andersonii.AAC.1